jgi:cupin 2 domain-containing protein
MSKKMEKLNIFSQIPTKIKDELFEDIITTQNIKIERIISDGHTSPKSGWYKPEQNEWVILLQGEAILEFEALHVELSVGDYFNIQAGTKHKVSYTSTDEKTI